MHIINTLCFKFRKFINITVSSSCIDTGHLCHFGENYLVVSYFDLKNPIVEQHRAATSDNRQDVNRVRQHETEELGWTLQQLWTSSWKA